MVTGLTFQDTAFKAVIEILKLLNSYSFPLPYEFTFCLTMLGGVGKLAVLLGNHDILREGSCISGQLCITATGFLK